ncbi:MAG: Rrf2 family transcriptional regulator [Pseudomonadota bacterium]
MLKPSKKLALALEAVVDIAYHGGSDPVQSQDIARRLGLPRRYLEQVMQQLVRAGILRGMRGPRGGYRLARERRRITIADVIATVSGNEEQDVESLISNSAVGAEVMRPFWANIENDLVNRLGEVTVEDLCKDAERAGIQSETVADANFVI